MNGDKAFKTIISFPSLLFLAFFILFMYELFSCSGLTWKRLGLNFIFGVEWNPLKGKFGALPFIYGTLLSSSLALVISVFLGLGIAIFLSEIAPIRIREFVSSIVELIAAVPSVVIGLWGVYVLAPFVRDFLRPALAPLSFIPLFSGDTPTGLTVLTAVIVLSFMITPITATIAKDSLLMVPEDLKEAMYSLGARRYEVVRHVSIPYARNGIFGGLILGYGRAIGETMAVAMVIGNSPLISLSLLSPGYTMAAVIANEFTEATGDLYLSSLTAIALMLMVISATISLIGRMVILRWQKGVS